MVKGIYYLDLNRICVLVSWHEGRLNGKGMIDEKSVHVNDHDNFRQVRISTSSNKQL
jgi:hypothetical protein